MYNLSYIFIIVPFLLGIYYAAFYQNHLTAEGFTPTARNGSPARCPDMLIQKGAAYFLYNSKLAKVPGVNPIRFNNLNDYVEFTEWQRGQGIRCPVLYVQEAYDAQGNPVYKARPSPTDMQGGLPDLSPASNQGGFKQDSKLYDAGQSDPPYNTNSYPAYDPQGQYIGLDTPLDKMYHEDKGGVSANPMDKNWGGRGYTSALVNAGAYAGDNVNLYVG